MEHIESIMEPGTQNKPSRSRWTLVEYLLICGVKWKLEFRKMNANYTRYSLSQPPQQNSRYKTTWDVKEDRCMWSTGPVWGNLYLLEAIQKHQKTLRIG